MIRAALLSGLLTALLALSGVAEAAALPRLGHHGRWVTDDAGRVVTLHGWNMVNKRPPYAPDAVGAYLAMARRTADRAMASGRLKPADAEALLDEHADRADGRRS